MKQIVVKLQLDNICKCVNGKWYETSLYHSDYRTEKTNRYIIEFKEESNDRKS